MNEILELISDYKSGYSNFYLQKTLKNNCYKWKTAASRFLILRFKKVFVKIQRYKFENEQNSGVFSVWHSLAKLI